MTGWTESLHPRAPKGKTGGGRFASAPGGGAPAKTAGGSGKVTSRPGPMARAQAHQNAAQKLRGQMRQLGAQIKAAQKAAAANVSKTAHMGPLPVGPLTGSVSGGSMGSKGVSLTIPKPKKAAKGKGTGIGLPIVTGTTTSVTPSNTITPPPLAPAASLPVMRQRMATLQSQHAAHMNRAQAYQRLAASRRVRGIPAFANDDSEALEMAMPAKMPMVRGAADVQCSRSAPGMVNVMHKSSGMKVGTLASKGGSWTGVHSTGKTTAAMPTVPGALSALIAMHNQMAGGNPVTAPKAKVKAMANGHDDDTAALQRAINGVAKRGGTVELAGALPFTSAATSSDGPRVTTMGGASKTKAMPAVKLTTGLSSAGVAAYRKLRRKGMSHAQALPMAKRAASMHAKAQAA